MGDLGESFMQAALLLWRLDAGLLEIVGLSLYVSLNAVVIASLVGMPLGALVATTRFPADAAARYAREPDYESWRERLHGECSQVPTAGSGMQYLTDGRTKYIYWPGTGQEQLFDIAHDPDEMTDLAASVDHAELLASYRRDLIGILDGRPEGFVEDGELQVLGGDTPACIR